MESNRRDLFVRGARWLARDTDDPSRRLGVAGALFVIGALSLLVAASAFLETSQRLPVLITGLSGAFALTLAGWFAGVFDTEHSRYR